MDDKHPSNLNVGEMSSLPTEGEEDFEVVEGPTWVGDGELLVTIRSGGKLYSETYKHTVTERIS